VAPKLRFETRSPEETREIGAAVGRRLKAGDVVATIGELGAGKTCFLQGMARGLDATNWDRVVREFFLT
jgi:tRNA threonylcarbamoyladenosine biosynthesis protein TsaE